MTPDLGLVKRLLMKLSGAFVSSSLYSNQNTFRIKDCNVFTLNNSEKSLELRFCHFVCPREKYHCIKQNHKGFREDIKMWFYRYMCISTVARKEWMETQGEIVHSIDDLTLWELKISQANCEFVWKKKNTGRKSKIWRTNVMTDKFAEQQQHM